MISLYRKVVVVLIAALSLAGQGFAQNDENMIALETHTGQEIKIESEGDYTIQGVAGKTYDKKVIVDVPAGKTINLTLDNAMFTTDGDFFAIQGGNKASKITINLDGKNGSIGENASFKCLEAELAMQGDYGSFECSSMVITDNDDNPADAHFKGGYYKIGKADAENNGIKGNIRTATYASYRKIFIVSLGNYIPTLVDEDQNGIIIINENGYVHGNVRTVVDVEIPEGSTLRIGCEWVIESEIINNGTIINYDIISFTKNGKITGNQVENNGGNIRYKRTIIFRKDFSGEIKVSKNVQGDRENSTIYSNNVNTDAFSSTKKNEIYEIKIEDTKENSYKAITKIINFTDDIYDVDLNIHKISYEANGGEGVIPNSTQICFGREMTQIGAPTNLTHNNHPFAAWNTQADGKGTSYERGEDYEINASMTLYAQFKEATVTYEISTPTLYYGDNCTEIMAAYLKTVEELHGEIANIELISGQTLPTGVEFYNKEFSGVITADWKQAMSYKPEFIVTRDDGTVYTLIIQFMYHRRSLTITPLSNQILNKDEVPAYTIDNIYSVDVDDKENILTGSLGVADGVITLSDLKVSDKYKDKYKIETFIDNVTCKYSDKPEEEETPPTSVEPPATVYYTVTLPVVEGATTDPVAGDYLVESWSNFRFALTIGEGYTQQSQPVVTANGIAIEPHPTSGLYIIKYVRNDVDVEITGITPDLPTSTGTIETGSRIYTTEGILVIETPCPTQAQVTDMGGRSVCFIPLTEGENRINFLASGFYIVNLYGRAGVKVIIR